MGRASFYSSRNYLLNKTDQNQKLIRDYRDNYDDSNKIRSSTGIAIDWFTPIGPLNVSLAQPLTKVSTDKTETFQFNLGTTF